MVGQRDPRQHDHEYMGWIARLPCASCMTEGRFTRGVHVAHLRAGSLEHGKRHTGMAERPHDRPWTTPLCPKCHLNGPKAQHRYPGGEVAFWTDKGVNPFQLCLDLSDAYENGQPGASVIARHAAKAQRARQ